MSRPTEVARTGTWTLVQVAAEAEITRALARAAVERGLLTKGPYSETDVVLARVAGACLVFPDPTALPARGKPNSTKRDITALRFTRAALTDPATTFDTVLLLAGSDVEVANTPEQTTSAIIRMMALPALVLPVGRWRALLPSVQHRDPVHPSTTLRLVKPNPGSSSKTSTREGYAAFTAAKAALPHNTSTPTDPPTPSTSEDPFALTD